jgi:hypothetical protein
VWTWSARILFVFHFTNLWISSWFICLLTRQRLKLFFLIFSRELVIDDIHITRHTTNAILLCFASFSPCDNSCHVLWQFLQKKKFCEEYHSVCMFSFWKERHCTHAMWVRLSHFERKKKNVALFKFQNVYYYKWGIIVNNVRCNY